MHVAVAIVGFRNPRDIVGCLEALGASTHADFEVVICENGGGEAWRALREVVADALPGGQGVTVHDAGGNLGYAGGVNRCIRMAPEADAWWVLNPDTRPDPTAMAAMIARLARGDCDAVGCTLRLEDGQVQSHGGIWRPWPARAVSLGHGAPREMTPEEVADLERRQNYLNGASMLMDRRFIETAGLMREDYFLYCEEVEWCLRGISLGLRLGYAPDAQVLHFQGTTTGNSTDVRQRSKTSVYLNERNRILLTRDLYPGRVAVTAVLALGLATLRFCKHRALRQLLYAIEGWAAGVLNRRGPPVWVKT